MTCTWQLRRKYPEAGRRNQVRLLSHPFPIWPFSHLLLLYLAPNVTPPGQVCPILSVFSLWVCSPALNLSLFCFLYISFPKQPILGWFKEFLCLASWESTLFYCLEYLITCLSLSFHSSFTHRASIPSHPSIHQSLYVSFSLLLFLYTYYKSLIIVCCFFPFYFYTWQLM